MEAILSTTAGVLIGGVNTWAVAWVYYKKAGEELKQEAAKLHSLTRFLGIKLHEKGLIQLPVDANGRPTYNQKISPSSVQ